MLPMQVGDGTTTVVILAGEFLKAAKPFIEENVHPRVRRRDLSVLYMSGLRNMARFEHLKLQHPYQDAAASWTRSRAYQSWHR